MGPMLRWFVFTIAMGLLPFGFSALLQTLRGVPPGEWQNSPEPLLFTVMICAAQLGGIFDTLARRSALGTGRRTTLSMFFGVFLIGAVLSAGLYGVYIDQERSVLLCHTLSGTPIGDSAEKLQCAQWLDFQASLYRFSIKAAGFVACLGTVAEWLRTRRRL